MWHEQNFRDRLTSFWDPTPQPEPELKHASAEWQRICKEITKLLRYVFITPADEFDADGTRDKLNNLIEEWVELDPKEAIGMAEAFMDSPHVPKEAVSMLMWNLLYRLYQKFMPDAF